MLESISEGIPDIVAPHLYMYSEEEQEILLSCLSLQAPSSIPCCTLIIYLRAVHWISQQTVKKYAVGGLFGHHKMMQKNFKIIETQAHGYIFESAQWELSNEYHHDMV